MGTFQAQYDRYRLLAEAYLAERFADGGRGKPWGRLWEAMGYSVLSGGKRVRPVLAMAVCEALGGRAEDAAPLGCALELVHTYSLIHDDLPCMDDDDLRRGRPACHKAYGETMAVLAGDALQAEAFRLLACCGLSGEERAGAVLVLASACGGDGMVAGQTLDMDGQARNEAELRQLCRLKTGALLRAAAELGCIAAGAAAADRLRAADYAEHLGLAFQVRDDMLDVSASPEELGKPVGSDREKGKRTFPDLLGLEGCQKLVEEETRAARAAAEGFPNGQFLLELADRLADRRS